MAMLEAMIMDGTVTLFALGLLGVELAVLIFLALARENVAAADMIANVVSGVFLILALRAALLQTGAATVAVFLTLAFAAHLVDTARRLRR